MLKFITEIRKHPDVTDELGEYIERGTVEIIESDEDLSRWLKGTEIKRIK